MTNLVTEDKSGLLALKRYENTNIITVRGFRRHLPTSKVVKVIAGDDQGAKATVTRLLGQFGFDTMDAGPLKERCIQHDTPGYGPRRTSEELRRDLAAAKRYADG